MGSGLRKCASQKVVSTPVSSFEQDKIAIGIAGCYNLDMLGNRLVVGQRTLNPPGKVRILLPQPFKVIRLPQTSY